MCLSTSHNIWLVCSDFARVHQGESVLGLEKRDAFLSASILSCTVSVKTKRKVKTDRLSCNVRIGLFRDQSSLCGQISSLCCGQSISFYFKVFKLLSTFLLSKKNHIFLLYESSFH